MKTRLKPRVNREVYIETLRRMTTEERLAKAFELSDMTHDALRAGLRQRYPEATDSELEERFRERLERCRSRSC
ncbi:MAG: hypothetical protein HY876_00420 [Coriobacteriales bacterium]|nr:hypothetical protein [Coriobacteriales bacterium]